jgi:hypothetical protein
MDMTWLPFLVVVAVADFTAVRFDMERESDDKTLNSELKDEISEE